ncbi:MAG: hypothetical protein ACOYH4_03415 [Saccharofermentanales bacterium]
MSRKTKKIDDLIEIDVDIRACCGPPYENQDIISRYLRNAGEADIAVPGNSNDIFTGNKIPGYFEGRHDEKYHWWTTLAYYVENYNLKLPEPFESHILSKYALSN